MAVTRIDYANLDQTLVGSEVVALSHSGEAPSTKSLGIVKEVSIVDGVVIMTMTDGQVQYGVEAGGYVEVA
jgi:hypothetical protein